MWPETYWRHVICLDKIHWYYFENWMFPCETEYLHFWYFQHSGYQAKQITIKSYNIFWKRVIDESFHIRFSGTFRQVPCTQMIFTVSIFWGHPVHFICKRITNMKTLQFGKSFERVFQKQSKISGSKWIKIQFDRNLVEFAINHAFHIRFLWSSLYLKFDMSLNKLKYVTFWKNCQSFNSKKQ